MASIDGVKEVMSMALFSPLLLDGWMEMKASN